MPEQQNQGQQKTDDKKDEQKTDADKDKKDDDKKDGDKDSKDDDKDKKDDKKEDNKAPSLDGHGNGDTAKQRKALRDAAATAGKRTQEENDAKREANVKKIQTALGTFMGDDYSQVITSDDLKKAVGGLEIDAAMGDAKEMEARQHLLDPTKYILELKKPNPGKMPNNEDAFPVDLKIEEFETHAPRVKIAKWDAGAKEGIEATKCAMEVGHTAEQRIVKLENNMSTIMRLLFRLGARVPINCVYYGGQSVHNKYKCIRCLKDDRIEEGQVMQIDQCLYCTRYEPIVGQQYELLNDLGVNVATILDDNQMSYGNMDHYIDMNRSERYHKETEKAKFDLSKIVERTADSEPFSTVWGKGIAMNWKLVPVETQKPHINWRQSINEEGSKMRRLASFPTNATPAGATNMLGNNTTNSNSNVFAKNKEAMDNLASSTDPEGTTSVKRADVLKDFVTSGQNAASDLDSIVNRMKDGWMDHLKEICKSHNNLDPIMVGMIAYAQNTTDLDGISAKVADIETKLGVQNPALTVAAYECGIEYVMGDSAKQIPRVDQVLHPDEKKDDSNKPRPEGDAPSPKKLGWGIDWDNRGSWLWVDFAVPLWLNANKPSMSLFPKVCYMYCAVLPELSASEFDGEWAAFPFTQEQINSVEITFTSKFGQRDGRIHHGIDLCAPAGTEIHAIADGTVIDPSGWGTADCNAVIVDHGNGTFSKYLHNSELCVSPGDKVNKGDVVSKVGNYIGGGPSADMAYHLHLEIGPEGLTGSSVNPIDYYPKLSGCEPERGNHYYDLRSKQLY